MAELSENQPARGFAHRVYIAVWRWHFWMGLLISPVLIVAAVTGALYVFQPQLEPALNRSLYFVDEVGERRGSIADFQGAVAEDLPGYHFGNVYFSKNPQKTWSALVYQVDEDGNRENLTAYYDPYSGEYLGYRAGGGFFQVVLDIHRSLLAGTPGRIIVELSTCWGIITILSGLYLWWPRNGKKLWGVWLPRVMGPTRKVLRDWHTVPGVYFSVFLILILVTGLLFTRIWGTAYLVGNALTGGLPEFYVNHPHNEMPEDPATPLIPPDEAYAIASATMDFSGKTHTLGIPKPGDEHPYEVISDITRPWEGIAVAFVDAYSGKVILEETGENFPLRTHLTLLFYPIHTGQIGGLATQILALISCLLLIMVTVLGVVMWWKRRPKGTLGRPRKPPPGPTPGWMSGLTLALAIFLPTVGLTLLVILLFGFLGSTLRRLLPGAAAKT